MSTVCLGYKIFFSGQNPHLAAKQVNKQDHRAFVDLTKMGLASTSSFHVRLHGTPAVILRLWKIYNSTNIIIGM